MHERLKQLGKSIRGTKQEVWNRLKKAEEETDFEGLDQFKIEQCLNMDIVHCGWVEKLDQNFWLTLTSYLNHFIVSSLCFVTIYIMSEKFHNLYVDM